MHYLLVQVVFVPLKVSNLKPNVATRQDLEGVCDTITPNNRLHTTHLYSCFVFFPPAFNYLSVMLAAGFLPICYEPFFLTYRYVMPTLSFLLIWLENSFMPHQTRSALGSLSLRSLLLIRQPASYFLSAPGSSLNYQDFATSCWSRTRQMGRGHSTSERIL